MVDVYLLLSSVSAIACPALETAISKIDGGLHFDEEPEAWFLLGELIKVVCRVPGPSGFAHALGMNTLSASRPT